MPSFGPKCSWCADAAEDRRFAAQPAGHRPDRPSLLRRRPDHHARWPPDRRGQRARPSSAPAYRGAARAAAGARPTGDDRAGAAPEPRRRRPDAGRARARACLSPPHHRYPAEHGLREGLERPLRAGERGAGPDLRHHGGRDRRQDRRRLQRRRRRGRALRPGRPGGDRHPRPSSSSPRSRSPSASGELRWYSTVKVPLVEEDGSCDTLLGVATDISPAEARPDRAGGERAALPDHGRRGAGLRLDRSTPTGASST